MSETRAQDEVNSSGQSEEHIAETIDTFLGLEGWQVFAFAKPRSHRHLGGIVPTGWFDRLAIKRTRLRVPPMLDPTWYTTYLHLEYKRPGLGLSPAQRTLKAELESMGCLCFCLHSVEEAAAMLRGLGYELRTGLKEVP